jgi:hypothetical protein
MENFIPLDSAFSPATAITILMWSGSLCSCSIGGANRFAAIAGCIIANTSRPYNSLIKLRIYTLSSITDRSLL